MGLISGLLLLPVAGPAKGLMFILEQIKERIDAEVFDDALIEEDLVLLSLRNDLGELSEDDFIAQETLLLERLNAVRAYREELLEPAGV